MPLHTNPTHLIPAMKAFPTAALIPTLAAIIVGGTTRAQEPPARFQAPALLIEEGGIAQKAWLQAATKDSIRYYEREIAANTVDAKINEFQAIYLYDPREYSQAMDLYQGRKYKEALSAFREVKTLYKPLQALENNHSTLSGFYEMECLRRLGDLDGLAEALGKFVKTPLTRKTQLRQIELYVIWDAVRTKSWDRVDIIAREYAKTPLSGGHRAQVAYCHGLALEGLKRPGEALHAYQTAITADGGASEDITKMAALRVLGIFHADPDVQNAMKVWGTQDENKASKGYRDLLEAAAMARLYELSLGAATPLPANYKPFLQFKASTEG
jgi:tetratricopeptide (TPR) repeat protein